MSTTAVTTQVKKPSIFSRIKAKLSLWFKELEKDEPKVEEVALGLIDVLAPMAETILAALDPALAALVNPIVSRIQAGLATLTVTIEDTGASPSVSSVIGSIKTNLGSIETAVGVKSAAAIAITGQVANELDAISAALFPAPTSTATTAA